MKLKYTQRKDGEGFTIPNKTIYKLACCDCHLVHQIVIAAPGLKKGAKIGFAAKRDNRATAGRRRKKQTDSPRDYATPPGDTLRETIKEKGISQTLLAETMGRPVKTINEIIHSKARITEHTAIELEHALNIPAHVWMALETNYRIALARKAEPTSP